MAEGNGDDGAPGYLSIMDSTQEVLPGIWLGGVVVAEDKARLTALNVSHILTLGPYMDPCFPDDWVYHVVDGILDMPARNILCYLPECVAFLETATTDGTGVYIHCQAGVSRSTTALCAFLMSRDGLSRDEALAIIKTARSIAEPNEGFMLQLALWGAMGNRLNDTNESYQQFLRGEGEYAFKYEWERDW